MTKIDLNKIENIIFDMDGTLYRLDSESGGFYGSSLQKKVNQNAISFIRGKENCSESVAIEISQSGKGRNEGLSFFLSERYRITRDDYFNEVWNINPEGIVKEFETAVESVNKLFENQKNLILLTAAPAVWKNKVIDYLKLNSHFSESFTGDMFETKRDIFEKLTNKLDVRKTLSVGDQLETDIKPARELGMKTFHVKHPREIKNLWKEK